MYVIVPLQPVGEVCILDPGQIAELRDLYSIDVVSHHLEVLEGIVHLFGQFLSILVNTIEDVGTVRVLGILAEVEGSANSVVVLEFLIVSILVNPFAAAEVGPNEVILILMALGELEHLVHLLDSSLNHSVLEFLNDSDRLTVVVYAELWKRGEG